MQFSAGTPFFVVPHQSVSPTKTPDRNHRKDVSLSGVSRQVFGLKSVGDSLLLISPSQQHQVLPVGSMRRSFFFTAAGQFRTSTGFPIS